MATDIQKFICVTCWSWGGGDDQVPINRDQGQAGALLQGNMECLGSHEALINCKDKVDGSEVCEAPAGSEHLHELQLMVDPQDPVTTLAGARVQIFILA